MFMRSDRILEALRWLGDDPDNINPVVAIFPVRGGGLSVRQLVELNGLHIASTRFYWEENIMSRAVFPKLTSKWVGQCSLPAACFKQVAEQYDPLARITHMEVEVPNPNQLGTVGVYVTNADGDCRIDRHRFKPVGYSRHNRMRWERIPHGGE